jgi:D-alanyl-D-alanine carboxypeptidase/D-alanyl-D-alanine-endopeptidase (penicillin-binding protein 4)
MLRKVRHAGINEISGDLLIDDSWFEVGNYDPAAFDHQPLRAYNVSPNALLMNFNVIHFVFEPDHQANVVAVNLEPPLENLRVENRLDLVAGSCRGYQRGITVTTNMPLNEVTFAGSFPRGCKQYALDRTVLSHNEFAYGLFRSLWLESGGSFSGQWRNVVADAALQPILSFDSLPLSDVITSVNKHSNNVMARHLLFTLAAEVNGEPGTEESGKRVISKWLVDNDLESAEIVIENGAGLSRKTRITAQHMGAILQYAWRQPYMPEYLASMPLSGLDGTLKERFAGAGLVGKAHLKTGSIDDVTAIAGYLQSVTGRRFAVVALQNHLDVHRGSGEEVQEALLRWLYEQ